MEVKCSLLNEVELFVLDMDGTFYLGDSILDGSLYFLEQVKKRKKKFLFFTNNSSKSSEVYIKKLKKMNCIIGKDQIMTSGDVMIEYLNTFYVNKKVFLLGTPELEESFCAGGIHLMDAGDPGAEAPDVVVIGFDTTLTYEKLERACHYIRNGAVYLATHLDINCPTADGFIPDCGAICAAISLSTGREPVFVGKPFPETVEMILKRTGVPKEKIAFVGDRLYTDVATGVNNGAKGILVYSGETRPEDLEKSQVRPHGEFQSLKEIGEALEDRHA